MRRNAPSTGRLDPGIIRKNALIEQTIGFVWDSLLPWRNDPERPQVESEEELNGYFSDFLNSRAPDKCPMVIFRHEQKQVHKRRVDIAAKPRQKVMIEGMTYTKYSPILVIEGKRLPAPSPRSREREYVSGQSDITGGIQRFKLGLHGQDHETAILLAYIQEGTPNDWHLRINTWIENLTREQPDVWRITESLAPLAPTQAETRCRCTSDHPRVSKCRTPQIHLHHFWVSMPTKPLSPSTAPSLS